MAQTWHMGPAPEHAKPDTNLTISVHKVAVGVYAARVRYGWVGWIEQGKGIVLIDAAMDAYAAQALEDSIRAHSGAKPITHLVLTHAHEDHVLGAKRFVDRGAILVVQEQVAAVVDSMLGRKSEPAAKGKAPSRIVVKRLHRLGPPGRVAEIIWLGHPAHTASDLIVYLPKQKVLFAGDVVSNRSVPWMLDPGMSVPGWKASVDSILTARFDADSLVPGHGRIGSKREAAGWMKRYLLDSWDRAAYYSSAGTKVTSFKDWGDLGAYTDVEFYKQTHFMNMRRLWYETQGIKTPGRPRARALPW
jgi:glyoxylase-like metal-dependent hydrolase (beta-lactamase superfamily II)